MKKSKEIADKVYEVLHKKCNKEFEDSSWREWHVVLRDRGISCKGFDNQYEMVEELMNIINNESLEFIVCPDPWVSINQVYEQEGFLIIPLQIAEKIAVLQGLP
jgi:hypothetical protein